MCSTKDDRTRRQKGKHAWQKFRRHHKTGRSGFARLAEKLVEIQRMIGNNPSSVYNDIDHDPVALVCGRDRKGRVRGLGSGISKTYFYASAPSREIAQREKRKSESLRDELNTLKICIVQQANEHKILQEQVASLIETRRKTRGSSGASNSEESNASETHLPSTCLIKNLRRKVVAIGRINREVVSSDETYNIVLDNAYEHQENMYDRDEKFGDVRIGDLVSWPKGFVEFIGV